MQGAPQFETLLSHGNLPWMWNLQNYPLNISHTLKVLLEFQCDSTQLTNLEDLNSGLQMVQGLIMVEAI